MNLGIRPVSLIHDRAEMIDILNRSFGASQELLFDWRHLENPAGESWSWFLYDKANLAMVGMATVFPRIMRVGGKTLRGGQVGEFIVDVNYRSLGPAVKLQRTTFEPVDRGNIAFCYDCPPHDQGMSTFVRLGIRPSCNVYRYAIPFRSDEYFAKRIDQGFWTKAVVAAANMLLRASATKGAARNIEIQRHAGRFSDEFSDLDDAEHVPGTVRSSRNADVLNWRYVEDPVVSVNLPGRAAGTYQILVARRRGELAAFVAFLIQPEGAAMLVDLFGVDSEVKLGLLEAALDASRTEGASSFFGICSEESELKPIFKALGFRRRERSAQVVVYTGAVDCPIAQIEPRVRWAFGQVEVML